ncbi:MAG: hypothetical protein Q9223_005297 [Gallowayella weberi]
MGWFSTRKKADDTPKPSALSEEAPTDSAPALSSTASAVDGPTTHDNDNSSDAELQALLSSLDTPATSNTHRQRVLPGQNGPTLSSAADSSKNLITPSILFTSTISCQSAFDSAYYCQSVGGQLNNIYRYGTFRDCSDHWKQFWFCMRTNRGFLGDEERERRVREHYRLKETKYRVGPSSEDIWRPRTRMVEGAFERNLEEDERMEREQGREEESRNSGYIP